jgi:hypothetical protein
MTTKEIIVSIPADSKLTKELIEELDKLFHLVPPSNMKNGLVEIFFSYLINTEFKQNNPKLSDMATDFYFMLKFLEKAEMRERAQG